MVALIFILIIAGAGYGWYTYQQHQTQLLRQSGITDIDRMSGVDFERRLAILFQDRGYDVETTPATGDYGADLILNNGSERIIVQAKRYSQTVGVKAIQEVASAVPFYGGTAGMVITNAYFSPNAVTLAQRVGITLWDRSRLIQELGRHPTVGRNAPCGCGSGKKYSQCHGVPPVVDRHADKSVLNKEALLKLFLQSIQNLPERQVLVFAPPTMTNWWAAPAIMRLNAQGQIMDGDTLYEPKHFVSAPVLRRHLALVPEDGTVFIVNIEEWDPVLLEEALLPWRDQIFVVAMTQHLNHVDTTLREHFSAEIPLEKISPR